jgi:sulfate adenylyltransferase
MTVNQKGFRLIAPHGGKLINRLCDSNNIDEMRERAASAPQVSLSDVSLSDLELIATGIVSPLNGFMNGEEYRSVVHDMHLLNGLPWTIPITLPVDSATAEKLTVGKDVALLNGEGRIVGLLELAEKFTYDKQVEAQNVYRTTEAAHPGVARLYNSGDVYLAGSIWVFELPQPAFPDIYRTPQQTRAIFAERGWRRIVAFQTRNPIHRAHEYLQKCALEIVDGLMLHPLVGETKSDDVPADVRVESYKVVLEHYYPTSRVLLTAFPAAMRYAGPREAIFHAMCRKNYGCTHFIVGRDHAGVGNYYGTYDAQLIFDEFDPQLIGITPLFFEHSFYCNRCGHIVTAKTCPHDKSDWLHLSGTQVRAKLAAGELLPEEFTRPEVSRVLMRGMRPVAEA